MLQRFEPDDAPLATVQPAAGLAAALGSAGSVMHFPQGDVAADFQPTGAGDDRHATYELLVSNETAAPLATFAYALDEPGNRRQMTWNAIVVPPFSAIAIEIDVAIPRRRRMPRVVAEVFANEAQLTLDAPPPLARRLARRFTAAISTGLLLALGAGAFAATRPRVMALAAPDSVPAGTSFSVAYALAATTDGHYTVETPDGLQIRRGSLRGGAGAFTVALPERPLASGYDVRVWADGRFGGTDRTTHVLAQARPSRPAPAVRPQQAVAPVRLGSLTLQREIVHGGESIVVTYPATANAGVVRLIDGLGTVRAEALLSHRGESILVAPHVEADQDFRIVATVERGRGRDEVTAPVTILHAPPRRGVTGPASVALAAPGTPDMPAADGATGVAPIAVDPVQLRGRGIVVRIDRYERKLHVALMGTSTEEIVGANVGPSDRMVVLTPPSEIAQARYEIVATYATGLGQETLIRPITFRAP